MNYDITLSSEQVRMAVAALAELPYKMSSPVIESILKQTDAQEKERTEAEQARRDAAAAVAQQDASAV
jgi:hypothetical protein